MTFNYDPRLQGRAPEFARRSTGPGIGGDAMHEVASALMALGLEDSEADVPSALRHGNRLMPLGRYLRSRLRLLVGKEGNAPQETLETAQAELLDLYLAARTNSSQPSFKQAVIDAYQSKADQAEHRFQLFRKKEKL